MAPAEAGSLESLFQLIDNELTEGDFKKCVKHAEAVLRQAPRDEDASRVKLYALIMASRFEEALNFVSNKDCPLGDVTFEKGYCQWKLGNLDQALEIIQAVDTNSALQLRALIHMRQGNSKAAMDAYSRLVQAGSLDKQSAVELATNAIAADVMLGEAGGVQRTLKKLKVSVQDSFEIAFNLACASVAQGDLAEAQRMLEMADTRGQELLLEEGATEEEVERELAVVHAQLAHVTSLSGDTDGAVQRYLEVLSRNLQSDVATTSLCNNNLLVLRAQLAQSDTLSKDASKKLSSFFQSGAKVSSVLSQRLSNAQVSALIHNYIAQCTMQLRAGVVAPLSPAECANTAARLASEQPHSTHAALLHAVTAALGSSADSAIDVVQSWLSEHPDADPLAPVLLAAHVAATSKPPQPMKVVELLRQLPDELKFTAGLLATRLALLEKQPGEAGSAGVLGELKEALSWWRTQDAGPRATLMCSACLEQLGFLHLRRGAAQEAAAHFKQIEGAASRLPPSELHSLTRCLAAVDPAAASALAQHVSAGPSSATAADIHEAEEMDLSYIRSKGTSVLLGPLVKPAAMERAQGGNDQEESDNRRRKRKRKPRYPKGFDPENPGPPPDKERWLPKHERAEFKKRRKRNQKNQPISKGAQGLGKVDQSLDKSSVNPDLEPKGGSMKLPARSAPKGMQGKRKGRR